jgi:hypothetical protein
MGVGEDITAWFERHHTMRKFVKGLIAFTIAFIVAVQPEIMANLPSWAIIPVGALILALDNYIKNNTTLPFVGKKAK